MRKIAAIIILTALAISMALGGCNPDGNKTTSSYRTPFLGGTTGLTLAFQEGYPPEEVYDNGNFPFDVTIQIKNEGEHTILPGEYEVTISGIDPAVFDVIPAELVQRPEDELTR
ncbi:hypothetical protein COY95_02055, partial [Candidatus Woesearchaeota archaeon CG_4_10_14_0_8_um_filter_47_5]